MIYCRTLGPLEVTVDGAPAPAELLWRKNTALLLYLARAPARRCTRDHAIGLLWPDKDEAAARQSLREAVRVLRRCVGEARLRTEHDQLELAAGAVELDIDRFEACVRREDWDGATPLVTGEFAEGFVVPDASGFEDWLLSERWHWRARAMDALLRAAEQRLAAGDLLGADEPARRAVKLDPLSDGAVRALMRRLALSGDSAAALELYKDFSERTSRERASPPDPETAAVAERIRTGRGARLAQTPRLDGAAERSVASRRAPLVGRGRELADLLEQWRGPVARSRRLAVAVIEAVPGGGKTRLVEELAARIALDGGACVTTRAVPGDAHHALGGIGGLAHSALVDTPGVAAAHPGALAGMARHGDAGDAGDAGGGGGGEWAERFPGAARASEPWALDRAVTEIVRASSVEQPLALMFDDAQWLDPASCDVLDRLVRDLAHAPVLVVLAFASESASTALADLRAHIGRDVPGVTVTLAPFDEESLRVLAGWAFPAFTADQVHRLARRLAADSAGLPLLAVEICHALAQGMDLAQTSGAWPRPLRTLDATLPGDLPETIVAAIRVGFGCLSPAARAALCAAAVLGERVSAARIGRAAHLEGEALHAALDELEWRRWLVAEPRGYAFVARIVRDVIDRDMVTEGQRQRLLASR